MNPETVKAVVHTLLLREDDEDDGIDQLKKASKGTKKLKMFFASQEPTQAPPRHRFFRERGITPATKL